jgi:nicotinamidase-related amidase
MTRLRRDQAVLLIIDVQEKLMPVIADADHVTRNIVRLVEGMAILGVPVLATEQYVRGLGSTVEPVRSALATAKAPDPIEKMCFSAHGCADFLTALEASGRRHVIVAGVETHVCVYQTVSDLLAAGYQVTLAADALSSRTAANKEIAIRRMTSDGGHLSSTEMIMFELTVASGTDEFRAIARLVK